MLQNFVPPAALERVVRRYAELHHVPRRHVVDYRVNAKRALDGDMPRATCILSNTHVQALEVLPDEDDEAFNAGVGARFEAGGDDDAAIEEEDEDEVDGG